MIILLIIFGLLGLAVLYGIFFLVFKLIWVLCKKQRNFWPLILAGAATLLTVFAVVWAVYRTVNTYIRPFAPIIEAVQTRTAPVYGAQAYADPRYGFGLTLYDGTVLSEWIDLPDNGPAVLLGVDTNSFLSNANDKSPFSGYLLARVADMKKYAEEYANAGALETARSLAQQAEDAQFDGEIVIDDVSPAYAGTSGTAAIIKGTLHSDRYQNESVPFQLLIAKEGPTLYALLGIEQNAQQQVEKTLRSFRLKAAAPQTTALPATAQ